MDLARNYKYANDILFSINNRKALLLCGFVLAFSILMAGQTVKSSDDDLNKEEVSAEEANNLIQQKREEIKQVQDKINGYNTEIKTKQKEARTLSREMSIYQSRINKNELEVEETKLSIEAAELEIAENENKVIELEEKREKLKETLISLFKTLYIYDQNSMLEILVTKNNISDFFNEVSATESINNQIFKTIVDFKKTEESLKLREVELEEQQVDQSQLIEMRYQQNESLDDLKGQKEQILEETKGEEEKFQQILEENEQTLPALKAQLMDLQSLGTKIKFDDAFSAAKYIGSMTGVRPAYLLAILKKESSLGTNVGGGTYQVDMSSRQRATFEAITAELGYDPNEMPVSRKPRTYSGWGGAMGPAQMMPTTWRVYQNEVSAVTGNHPPDPWDLTDALAAMAIKVSKVQGVTEGSYDAEYEAAGLYFAGRNWRRYLFYPNQVMLYASLYEEQLGG